MSRLGVTALVALLLLSAVACEFLEFADAEITATVKEELGLDLNDPGAMVQLAGAGQVAGDKNRALALNLVRDARRVQHETLGDEALEQGKYDAAATAYREALRWAQPSLVEQFNGEPAERKKWRADVQSRLGVALLKQVVQVRSAGVPVTNKMYLDAARNLREAVDGYPPGNPSRVFSARLAGTAFADGGDTKRACEAMATLGDQASSLDMTLMTMWGCFKRP